jgi:hypothetical protein
VALGCLSLGYQVALGWLWVAFGRMTPWAADDRKRGHSRPDSLSAHENPCGGGLFHPPSSIRYPRGLRNSHPGSLPEAVRASRNKESRERPNYEGRSLKSQSRRSKPRTYPHDPGNDRIRPQIARFGLFPASPAAPASYPRHREYAQLLVGMQPKGSQKQVRCSPPHPMQK